MSGSHTARLHLPGDTALHRMAPEAKLLAAFAFVAAVAVTPRRAMFAFAIYAVVVLAAVAVAGLGPRRMVARLAPVLPFAGFAVLIPLIAGGETTAVAGLELSTEGLWGTWNILAKAVLGTSVSVVLATTTSVPDILAGLGRLRLPAVLVSIVAFMFRYLDLIADQLGRMRVAMASRAHDPRWLHQAKPLATAAGATFVRTYERGERVHAAMLARGFDGTMPDVAPARAAGPAWPFAAIGPAIAIATMAVALAGGLRP